MVCLSENNGNNDEQCCVNVFPTDEKTPYEQGENHTVIPRADKGWAVKRALRSSFNA